MDGSYGILLLTCLTRWNPCNGNRKLGAWKTLPQTYDSWYQKRFSSSKLLFLLLTWLGNQNHHLTLHRDNSNGFFIMVFKSGHAFRVNQDIIKNQNELSHACFLRHLHFFRPQIVYSPKSNHIAFRIEYDISLGRTDWMVGIVMYC